MKKKRKKHDRRKRAGSRPSRPKVRRKKRRDTWDGPVEIEIECRDRHARDMDSCALARAGALLGVDR